jgi:hypothetical protein
MVNVFKIDVNQKGIRVVVQFENEELIAESEKSLSAIVVE